MRYALVVLASGALTSAAHAQKACVEVDKSASHVIWPQGETSPARSEVDALERRLKTAPANSVPAVLLQLGRMKTRLVVDSAYAAARPDEYRINPFGSQWMYTGWHFSELIRKYPRHRHVSTAAYELTYVPAGGECEGYVPCHVASLWGPIEKFLRAYPTVPLADSAVQRALLAFSAITPRMDLVRGGQEIDPPELLKHVNSLEEVANLLSLPNRALLLTRVAELREQLGDLRAARTTFRVASSVAGTGRLAECTDRQVTRLEARLARP